MSAGLRKSIGVACLAATFAVCQGCKQKDSGPDILTLKGKVDQVETADGETGTITVMYFSERQGRDVPGTGMVTKETEIMINGVVSKLSDVRLGDRVLGEVRLDKQGDRRVQTALKIVIDRPKPVGGD